MLNTLRFQLDDEASTRLTMCCSNVAVPLLIIVTAASTPCKHRISLRPPRLFIRLTGPRTMTVHCNSPIVQQDAKTSDSFYMINDS